LDDDRRKPIEKERLMPDTETIAPEVTEAVDVEQSPVEAASARWTEAQYGPETAVETPEVSEAAPVEGAAPEAKMEPEIDPAFLARAESYGLGKDDLVGLEPQRAEQMFAAFDRRLLAGGPQTAPVVEAPKIAPAAEVASKPFELTLDPDEVGEPVINAFKGLQSQFQEKLSGYEQRTAAAEQAVQSLNTMMEIQAFDGFLAGMGEGWSDMFGKGATLDLNENSKEFKERGKLLQQAFALRDVYAQKFGQNLPRAELFKRAHAAVYSDEIRKRQLSELNGKMKERAKQHTERPGKQERPPAAPREQAESTWKSGMRKIRNY
jgi:hypothetical protein